MGFLIVMVKSITYLFFKGCFSCVSLQVSLNIFRVLNHFGCVYGDDDFSFV